MIIRLVLEHHNPAAFDILRSKCKALEEENRALHTLLAEVEQKYGAEVQYNAALCDLLRVHGIPFRAVFSHEYRYRNAP